MVLMCVPLLVSMVDVLVSVTGPLTTKRSSFSTVRGKLFIGCVVVNWVQVEPYITVLSLGSKTPGLALQHPYSLPLSTRQARLC